MDELTTSQRFGCVVQHVLKQPLSIGIWVVGGVGSYMLHSPIPIGLCALAQVGLVFNGLNSDEYLRRVFSERQAKADGLSETQIEATLERMDFETRQRLRYILQLQKEVAEEARSGDSEAYTRKELDKVASKLQPLLRQAVKIADRRQKLAGYLQNVDERALQNYVKSVKQKINAATDPVQKYQYEQALKARETEVQTYQAIAQAMNRIDSQLENLEATFASWKAKVIRIKTADVAMASSVSDSLIGELDILSSEIDLLDSSVSEALANEQYVANQ